MSLGMDGYGGRGVGGYEGMGMGLTMAVANLGWVDAGM